MGTHTLLHIPLYIYSLYLHIYSTRHTRYTRISRDTIMTQLLATRLIGCLPLVTCNLPLDAYYTGQPAKITAVRVININNELPGYPGHRVARNPKGDISGFREMVVRGSCSRNVWVRISRYSWLRYYPRKLPKMVSRNSCYIYVPEIVAREIARDSCS